MKQVNILDLVSISEPEILGEYINLLGEYNTDIAIKMNEISCLENFITHVNLSRKNAEGFYYSYSIPQIGKEFDLIKICGDSILNIELKSEVKSDSVVLKQLKRNLHYFNIFSGVKKLYCFVQNTHTIYKLEQDCLVITSVEDINQSLREFEKANTVDPDMIFSPNKFLVSPLNSPDKFLKQEYFLTEQQQNIKFEIIETINSGTKYFGITGKPGTGKTLLLYDIAVELSRKYKVGIVHCGFLNSGHDYLNQHCKNIEIIEVKALLHKDIKNWNIIMVDETHRIYDKHFEKIAQFISNSTSIAILSFDETQILSKTEDFRNISGKITNLCGESGVFKLSKKIRTNNELSAFIETLFNKGKKNPKISYSNVHLYYSPSLNQAVDIKNYLCAYKNYRFIAYTPSRFTYDNKVHNQIDNTHRVIGQEFNNVVMLMGPEFNYDKHILKSRTHKNPDYLYVKLLFQGLTRVRNELSLVIYDNLNLLRDVVAILRENKNTDF